MIWNPMDFVLAFFGTRREAAAVARRWTKACASQPELAADLIRLGGVMTAQPFEGFQVADLDPARLAYEAGRRDFALQLLALGGMTPDDFKLLMEDDE